MIEIELKAKDAAPIQAVEHPDYLDYPVRDSRTRTSWAKVAIHVENRAAPIVAGLNGKTTIETYTLLTSAINELRAKHPNRLDAIRVLEWHRDTGRPHPNARWHVTGAEGVPKNVRWIERATQPRFSFTSKTADPLTHGIRWLGEGERMAEMEPDDDLDRLLGIDLGRWDEISGAALLQREVNTAPTFVRSDGTIGRVGGGGGSSSGKKDKPPASAKELREKTRRALQEDGFTGPREKYFARVRPEIKNALQQSGVGPKLIEALGRALLSGKSVEQITASLTSPPGP